VLSAQTRRLPDQPGMEGRGNTDRSSSTPERDPESSPAVRTFGIADPDAKDEDETQYENF